LINKQFEKIEKSDIDALIVDEVRENRSLEYKEALPGNADDEKREFLSDISALANAAGGDIVYGVREKRDSEGKTTGFPEAAEGIPGINVDAEVRRLENVIRDGIEPRIPGLRMRSIGGFSGGSILHVRVLKSWISPHMVTFKNLSRFYSRNSAGKYQLDIGEIRSAFASSDALPERIRRFRDDRLAKIVADETPVQLKEGPRLVLHLVPVGSLGVGTFVDPTEIVKRTDFALRAPIDARGGNFRYNADGYLSYYGMTEQGRRTYLQIFRRGMLEAVWADIQREDEGVKYLPGVLLESEVVSSLTRYLELIRGLGEEPPVFLQIGLVGVMGYPICFRSPSFGIQDSGERIDRDHLILPDIVFDDYEGDIEQIMKPVFDAMWQASGWERSQHYDAQGIWIRI
jgi:hypothetical protein